MIGRILSAAHILFARTIHYKFIYEFGTLVVWLKQLY